MPMKTDDIKKIAQLARLKLSEAEVAAYRRDFAGILSYVDQLRGLTLPPLKKNKSAAVAARLRADRVSVSIADEQKTALDQFSDQVGRQLKTKRIL